MEPLITITGPRNARTHPDSGLRFYEWQGIEYPSVTTLRRMAGMPFGLHNWAVTKVVDRAVNELDALNRRVTNNDEVTLKAAKTWLRSASTEERDRAANLGSAVHEAAASQRKIGEVPQEIAPFLSQYYNWVDDTGVEIIQAERQAWNLSLGYAGTFDSIARFPDKTTYIVDLKTGKGTYPEHCIQAVAYAMAEFVGEDDKVDDEATKQLLDVNGLALLNLRPDGWKWQVISVTPELFAAFKGLLTFAVWAHRYQDMTGLVEYEIKGNA